MLEEDAATDASFQKDPEHYQFTCLSEEEVWNYLDMQVRDLARDLKVGVRGGEDECSILLPPSLSISLSLPPSLHPGGCSSGPWAVTLSAVGPD